MPAILVIILGFFTRDLIYQLFKYVFTGFLGMVSYSFMQNLIDRYINVALSELLNTDAVSPIVSISRLDDFLSIIIGAMTICVAIKAMGVKFTALGG